MKAVLPFIKRILLNSCICFTLMTLFLFAIGSAIPAFGDAIKVSSILTIYLFSLLLALANRLLTIEKMKIGWRVLLHYLASLAAFYVVFIIIAMKLTGPRSSLIGILLFTILYAIIMGIYLFLFFSYANKGSKKTRS